MERCPHGFEIGKNRLEGVYAAPIGKCRCCGSFYTYIGSGMMSIGKNGETTQHRTSPDPNRCYECDGQDMILQTEGGRTLVYEPGSHGPPTAKEARNYIPEQPPRE